MDARKGTITIESFSIDGATGSFDLVFPNGTLKGTFAAPTCALAPSDAGPDAAITCQQY